MDRKELHVSLKCEEAILHMKGINPTTTYPLQHPHSKNIIVILKMSSIKSSLSE